MSQNQCRADPCHCRDEVASHKRRRSAGACVCGRRATTAGNGEHAEMATCDRRSTARTCIGAVVVCDLGICRSARSNAAHGCSATRAVDLGPPTDTAPSQRADSAKLDSRLTDGSAVIQPVLRLRTRSVAAHLFGVVIFPTPRSVPAMAQHACLSDTQLFACTTHSSRATTAGRGNRHGGYRTAIQPIGIPATR